MADDWPQAWRPREEWANMTYAEGGWIEPGVVTAINATGAPEPVFTAEQIERGRGWIREQYDSDE